MGIFPNRGENQKYLKPPPSNALMANQPLDWPSPSGSFKWDYRLRELDGSVRFFLGSKEQYIYSGIYILSWIYWVGKTNPNPNRHIAWWWMNGSSKWLKASKSHPRKTIQVWKDSLNSSCPLFYLRIVALTNNSCLSSIAFASEAISLDDHEHCFSSHRNHSWC